MSALSLTIVLVALLLLRFAYLFVQLRDLDSFWYDLERGGFKFQVARAISVLTFVAFLACATYALWTLEKSSSGVVSRYATLFVVWFGLSLLSRFPLHRFPRTNSPRLYSDAQLNLVLNLVLALLSGLVMTGLSAVYFWWRG